MRLIDADEIRWADHYDSDGNLSKYKIAYSDEMPPTVDAVPVVRCRDCKYYEEQDETIGTCLLTESGAHIKGYCSWAEVKEE